MLRATTACTFSTSQLPKVVRTWCALYILTWKRASRHNGVHFFDISTSKSDPNVRCFFSLTNVLRATTACSCSSLIWPAGSAPAAFAAERAAQPLAVTAENFARNLASQSLTWVDQPYELLFLWFSGLLCFGLSWCSYFVDFLLIMSILLSLPWSHPCPWFLSEPYVALCWLGWWYLSGFPTVRVEQACESETC